VSAQARIYLLPQALSGKSVGQVQCAETSTISQRVVDKIHRPPLPRSRGRYHFASLLTLEPLLAPLSQSQFLFPIQAVCLLVIEVPAIQTESAM
jgi:hypothetical protein